MPVKDTKRFKKLTDTLKERAKANELKREATNMFNRVNTAAKNAFKDWLQNEPSPPGTIVRIGGVSYKYAVAEHEEIDPRLWHKMWKDKEITEEQYFAALGVGKEIAKQFIGEDQVVTISAKTLGTAADIRQDDSDPSLPDGVITPKPIAPPKGIRRREGLALAIKPLPKPAVRLINVRRK